jgi:Tol biopolymer transport system component
MTSLSRSRPPTLVYTGAAGNIFTWTPTDSRKQQLTWSWEEQHNVISEQASSARLTHIWPTWAPDGSRVVCFGLRGRGKETVQTSVFSVAADGIESWELAGLSGGMPIYGNWSPRGDAFAALIQRGEQDLSLEIIRFDGLGKTIPLLNGAPLFWSWSPRGDRLAVHVGGTRRASAAARVVILDAVSGQTVHLVTDRPGEFRVPAWAPHDDLLAYTEQDSDGHDTLFLLDVATGEKGPVAGGVGGTAVVWSPDGNTLAFAHAARPGSSLFAPIRALDLSSGRTETLLEAPVTGFFWSPQNEALLYVSLESGRSYLRWNRLLCSSGEITELARFLPSREQMFVLSFFDQYTLSHPPLAPDGKTLAFAGYLINPSSSATAAQVYLLPLDRTDEPRPVATGDFVCWNLNEPTLGPA